MPLTRRNRIIVAVLSVAAVSCLLYAAAGFFLVPRLIERQLETLARERLGHTLTLERTRVNPFALSVEFAGLRLAPQKGAAPLTTRRLYVNLALARSLVGRGLVLDEVQCDELQAVVELNADGHVNVAELARKWRETAPPAEADEKESGAARVTIAHLKLNDGVLTYRELTDAEAVTQMVPIQVELQNVSTLPDREGRYSLAARLIDGGNLTWRGDLSLQPLQSEGEIELQSLQLATVWKFVRDEVDFSEPQGWVTLSTRYRFSSAGGKQALDLDQLRIHGAGLKVGREGFREPLVTLASIDVRDGRFSLGKRSLELPRVALADGSLSLTRDVNGAWNWADFSRKPVAVEPAAKPGAAGVKPWHVDVAALTIEKVAVNFRDWQHPAPLLLRAALNGSVAIVADAGGEVPDVQLTNANVALTQVHLPEDETKAFGVDAVRVQGGYLQLARHELGAKRVEVHDATVRVERNANGSIPLLQMIKTPEQKSAAPPQADASPPWRYVVDAARLRQMDIAWIDHAAGAPTKARMHEVSADVTGLGSRDKPLQFKASATVDGGGTLAARGTAKQDFSQADATVTLGKLALAPYGPLIGRYAAVDLVSGSASARANVRYRRDEQPRLLARIPFEIANVRFNEAGTQNRLVSWKLLSSPRLRVTLDPDRITAREIVVEQPEVKVDVSEQRRLNLLELARPQPDSPAPATSAATREPSPIAVNIGEVRLRDGTVDYADRSLVLPFATRVTNFRGSASSLSTDRQKRASLQFQGEIGEFGSTQVRGELDAFAPKSFLDIQAVFENVAMPELSPYTATFLGRKIDSGKLWLDLVYHVENGALTGDNSVTIRELALGEPVDAPGVRRLPLDLAVALLTDSQGVIRADVPVKGDVNDPKFDIGAVVRDAIGNVIGKIVSAPFRALAGLVGGKDGGQDASRIAFEPGSSELKASEREKLQAVAKALDERPQLKLVVQAPFAPEADREAVQREQAARELADSLGRTLEPGEKPGPVVFDNLATQRALERAFAKKTEPAAEGELVEQYTQKSGQEPKRAGMLFRRPGDPDFYKAMFERLVKSENVGDDVLRDLATRRAQAVLESLRSAGIEPGRLQSAPVKASRRDGQNNVGAELSLQPVGHRQAATMPDVAGL